MKDIMKSLQWRYATKQFDSSKKISAEQIEQIEDSMVLTPSSFGLQPWKFIVIEDPALRASLVAHSWDQPQVVDCSHFVVLTSRRATNQENVEAFLNDVMQKRGVTAESLEMYKGMMLQFISAMSEADLANWAKNQTYIALGQLMSTVATLEIDACPMEGIIHPEYDKILGLEDSPYQTVVACALGYRSAEDKYASAPKVRFDKNQIIERR